MAKVQGIIQSVVYNKGSFYILSMRERTGKYTTVKGNIFGVDRLMAGVPFNFSGIWKTDSKHGKQLLIQSWDFPQKISDESLMYVLEYAVGMDPLTSATLVEKYRGDVLSCLKQGSKVQKDLGETLGPALSTALAKWDRLMAVRALSEVLKDGGLTGSDIEAAVIRFGSQAPDIIKENPFRLMEIPGFNFGKVDKLALRLGFDPDNPQRLEGATLWALDEAGRDGHLYLRRGDIPTHALDLRDSMGPLPVTDTADRGFKWAVDTLAERGSIVVDPQAGAYAKHYYEYERSSAEMLTKLMTPSPLQVELKPFLEEFERSAQMELSEAQQEAVEKLIENKVLVLTGLPGTGKTTAVKALVRLFEVSRTSFVLMAPTGIASKRLGHVTGQPAMTVHRALGYDGWNWKNNEHNKLVVDAVIVDEMSMVDMELFYRLLSALRDDTMLVLVGDDAQLPSVGPGNVLRELVSCDAIPSVRLTKIFRQSDTGDIVSNSHMINRGENPVLGTPRSDSEFRFIPMSNEEKAQDYIVKMALKLKERDANFQVLSPKYDGPVGVRSLNYALRDAINPSGPPEWQSKDGEKNFRVGDRLMVIKNNYKKGIYNGDVGKLLYISERHLVMKIYGVTGETDMEVNFTSVEAEEHLRLAYAITVHKSQGSEFDTIILPVALSQGRMLQRNLLYTAVTRAKKRVWLIGQELAIHRAVENNKVLKRNTVLGRAVTGVLEGDNGG